MAPHGGAQCARVGPPPLLRFFSIPFFRIAGRVTCNGPQVSEQVDRHKTPPHRWQLLTWATPSDSHVKWGPRSGIGKKWRKNPQRPLLFLWFFFQCPFRFFMKLEKKRGCCASRWYCAKEFLFLLPQRYQNPSAGFRVFFRLSKPSHSFGGYGMLLAPCIGQFRNSWGKELGQRRKKRKRKGRRVPMHRSRPVVSMVAWWSCLSVKSFEQISGPRGYL